MIMEDHQDGMARCTKYPAYLNNYEKQPWSPSRPPLPPPRKSCHDAEGSNQKGTVKEDTRELERQQTLGEKICLIFVCILIFIPVICFLLFAIQSKIDSYHHKPLFKVERVRLFPFHITSSRVMAHWNIKLSILNPKNTPIRYENFTGWIYLRGQNISSTMVRNFTLDGNKERKKTVILNFGAPNIRINKSVGEAIVAQTKAEIGVVSFSLKLRGFERMYPRKAPNNVESVRTMSIQCLDIKVIFASTREIGTLLRGPIKCQTIFVQRSANNRKDLPVEVFYGMHTSGNLRS